MISVDVFYDGWGEHWRWGTLATTTALTGRPVIVFEYSPEAQKKGWNWQAIRYRWLARNSGVISLSIS